MGEQDERRAFQEAARLEEDRRLTAVCRHAVPRPQDDNTATTPAQASAAALPHHHYHNHPSPQHHHRLRTSTRIQDAMTAFGIAPHPTPHVLLPPLAPRLPFHPPTKSISLYSSSSIIKIKVVRFSAP